MNGPAGYGTTILCADLFQRLQTAASLRLPSSASQWSSWPPTAVTHFFTLDLEARGDTTSIVRSWLSQLVAGNDKTLNVAWSRMPANETYTATARGHGTSFAETAHAIPEMHVYH
jgi:hypothetical protein